MEFVYDPSRPDPRAKSVHVEIERTSLRLDKVRGLVGDPSGPWVWSDRARAEFYYTDTDSTRPDQTKSADLSETRSDPMHFVGDPGRARL